MVAHVCVDGVGKVHGGRAAGQGQDLALGREDVHGVGKQVDLDVLQEFAGVSGLALDVEQRLQPLVRAPLQVVERRAVLLFVEPVRGHAFFGHVVHVSRAELEFYRRAVGPDQRGVERLVAIHFGDGDIVLELARDRPVELVQRPHCQIAFRQRVDDHAKAVDVEHVRKRLLLLDHLFIDAVEGFFAARDFGVYARGWQCRPHRLGDARDYLAPVAAGGHHRLVENHIAIRVDRLEATVLQLAEQGIQAQAVSDRCVDVQRLSRHARAFFGAHVVERAHVVQAVGELDQNDAHVARHGQQHLAEGFRLLFSLRRVFQTFELGQTVDDVGDFRSELFRQLLLGNVLVFDDVVQERRHERIGVELPARADLGDGDGV
ncbi:hypothetical protein CDEF62S_01541 [Castellaniella defragrans]